MGLSRRPTDSEMDGGFSQKSQNFPTTLLFCTLAEGWNWVPALGV